MTCRLKKTKLEPSCSYAATELADSTSTIPTIVRTAVGTNSNARLLRVLCSASLPGRTGGRTTRSVGRPPRGELGCRCRSRGRACGAAARPARGVPSATIGLHGDRPGLGREPVAAFPVVTEHVPARTRGRQQHGPPAY